MPTFSSVPTFPIEVSVVNTSHTLCAFTSTCDSMANATPLLLLLICTRLTVGASKKEPLV